ncbi:MAG: conjugal transfer family protein [Candidatus Xenolissoclinum pacificiensis L6]|uniref:Conjugal transfer family protein n=1 Tax=Candidatus Xenolissoclinum pacificiensis L6 TaxID=1401685 RepID=W2V3B1_9RICK|nr:MAG: conjugal transfer family protein [Candidatus Xenolissoclinum pacificiensis L6]
MNLFRKYLLLLLLCLYCTDSLAVEHLPISIDSRMRTYVYSPTEVFIIKGHFDYTTVVEFATGEVVYKLDMGDPSAWRVTVDEVKENRLILKPLLMKGATNMVVFTNMRTYVFDLIAQEKVNNNIAYIVRFYYPDASLVIDNDMISLDGNVSEQDMFDDEYYRKILTSLSMKDSDMTVDDALKALELVKHTNKVSSSSDMKFKLNTEGDPKQYSNPEGDISIAPSLVYHNNNITVFRFDNVDPDELPQIFRVLEDLTEERLKMVWLGDLVAVNGVHDVLSFRYANKNARIYKL